MPGASATAAAEVLAAIAVAGERALGGARGRETVEEAHYGVPKDREVEDVPGRRDEQCWDRGHGSRARGAAGSASVKTENVVLGGQDRNVVGGDGIYRERNGAPRNDLGMIRQPPGGRDAGTEKKHRTHDRGRQDH